MIEDYFGDYILPGNIVYLNSGSPDLLVMACNEETIWVVWNDDGLLIEKPFPRECLEKE